LEIPPEAWRGALATPLEEALDLKPGKTSGDFANVGDQQLDIEYGRDLPRDPETNQPLDPAWLVKNAAKGFVELSHGARRLSVRVPPAECAPLLPGVACVVGELLDPPPPAPPAAAAPVSFHCSSCGEILLADGTASEVECPKCHAETEVPEALWAKRHPDFPPARWFLLYDEKSELTADAAGKVFTWDEVTDLIIDEDDNLYLACSTDGRDDAAIASFRPDLTVRWV
jgi:hypothetical protein